MKNKRWLASTACIFLSALTITSVSYAEDVSAGTYVLQSRVSSSTDDAEERSGTVDISSSDLELVAEGNSAQTVGVRFTNISLPENAIISKAYIQYTVDERSEDNADLTIHGENIANAAGFTNTDYNISGRTKTNTSVSWSPAVWDTIGAAGEAQRTPDLSSIVQEIISKTGWESDNAIAFILSGAGVRIAEAYDGDETGAPRLYLEYTTDGSITPPVVEQPIVEEPIVEEPIVEQPIVEEPIVEEPIVEQPIVEEPIVEQPIVEQPVTEEPVVYVLDEQSSGFCSVDGGINSDNEGFTGFGFINTDNTMGSSIRWSINAKQAGVYPIEIRYANGGDTARAGLITVDGADSQTVTLNSTGTWTSWQTETINIALESGDNEILIKANGMDGLANIDKITLTGNGLSDAPCAEIEAPIVEQPIVEQPIVEEPIVEEPIFEQPIVEEPIVEQPVIDEPVSKFDVLNVTGSNNDLVEGTFTASNSANLGTQSKRSIHQGGFGTDSVCGLNGEVIKVTNLNDSGTGSLRDAINQKGPRTIVFEVSGAIKLQSQLVIDSPFVTIAGQTAPAPGISLYHEALKVDTHDVCMQHMRVRLGDSDYNLNPISPEEAGDADALVIRGGRDSEGTYNVILDNMSVSWSVDEAISVFGGVSNLTIRDSIIAEPLRYNAHETDHAYCLLIRSESERVSLIGNLFGHCQRRSPRMDGGTLQYVNNFIYNPGEYAVSVHDLPIDVTMAGNVMDFPDDSANRYEGGADALFSSRSPDAKVYFNDNQSFEDRPVDETVEQGQPVVSQSVPRVWEGNVTALTAAEVEKSLTDWVGAFPRNRDEVDARIIEGVRTHTGNYLDSQIDDGGYVYVEENNRFLMLPENPQNDDDNDGISNLVEWLQSYTDAIE